MGYVMNDAGIASAQLSVRDDRIISANHHFVELTGYCQEDVQNRSLSDVFRVLLKSDRYPDEHSSCPMECYIFTRAHVVKRVRVSIGSEGTEGCRTCVFIERDMSFLNSIFSFLENIYEKSDSGFGVISAEGLILLKGNRYLTEYINGFYNSGDSCIGDTVSNIFNHFGGVSFEQIQEGIAFPEKSIHIHELRYDFPSRGTTYWDVIAAPIREGSDIRYITVVVREVTEVVLNRIRLEEQAKTIQEKNQQLQAVFDNVSDLVYTITHEFKTPLTVILSAIQAMERLCWNEMPPKAMEYVQKIKQNSYRQLRLVSNLLELNRISVGKPRMNVENMDIVQATRLITDSVQVYAQQKRIRLMFSTAVKSKIVGMDYEKYERMILNLLSNAIKYTPGGGAVYVRVSVKRTDGKNMVCIEVEDEGIGIPNDKFDVIFERFGQVDSSLTRNVEGTGLGLTLVKQIVESFGGSITVDSAIGKGSIFTVLLPAAKVNNTKKGKSPPLFMNSQLDQVIAVEFSDIRL